MAVPSYPSHRPSPRKLALASLHLSMAASASGCGWRGSPLAAVEKASPLPLGEGQGEGYDAFCGSLFLGTGMETRIP
jgi:hypothetical protein